MEGGAKIFGVFRVKNHDFTPKNHIFSDFRGGGAPPPWIRPRNGCNISMSTVRRVIDVAGFVATKPRYCQLIREPNKEARVAFCKALVDMDEQFEDVVFTDESSIQSHYNKPVAYRQKDAMPPNQCRPKHPLKIHLWGRISKRGLTQLLIFSGIMESEFYTNEILKNTLKPFLENVYPDGHRLQQDNDPKHTSIRAKNYMTANNINWWKWPSESPDINPIEMVWSDLKRVVAKQNPTTLDQLEMYCQQYWDTVMTPEKCTSYIDHLYKVVPLVVTVAGKAMADLPGKLYPKYDCSIGLSISHYENLIHTSEYQLKLGKLLGKQ